MNNRAQWRALEYLLFADLPDDAAVVVGTRVSFDIVPGHKPGETKAGNIMVHGGPLMGRWG